MPKRPRPTSLSRTNPSSSSRKLLGPYSRKIPSSAVILGCALVLPAVLILALTSRPLEAAEEGDFTNFETEPVRPIALAPDGRHLYVLNTADDRLEVWANDEAGTRRIAELRVGLRPVAVAAGDSGDVWVSNHLGDSVSLVDVSDPGAPVLRDTFPVGDEPRDLVIAGRRVFVASARRSPVLAPLEGQAEVWVFDRDALAAPPQRIPIVSTKLRGLAVGPNQRRVYAAVFRSGNQTTVIDEEQVFAAATPTPSSEAFPSPRIGRILQQRDGGWRDEEGRDWRAQVPFSLPDEDVFVIDALAAEPRVLGSVIEVGTILFNLAVHPNTGEIWVTNTEARNTVRFEPALKGSAVQTRVTRLIPGGQPDSFYAEAQDLNPHLADERGPEGMSEQAWNRLGLSQATGIAFLSDGSAAWAAVFGSNTVIRLNASAGVTERVRVGAGPAGVAIDEARRRLFVLNHLSASLSVVDLDTLAVREHSLAYDPRPEFIRAGQAFLYDAALSSSNGSQSCASCHVFADMDGIAWDLGVPGGAIDRMPFDLTHEDFKLKPRDFWFHPEKGPMMTQSFRGMAGTGPLHWRGDRFARETGPQGDPGNFARFNPAFRDLLGRTEPLSDHQMQAFGRFVFSIRYPPNPLQRLDRGMTEQEAAGAELFSGEDLIDSGVTNCEGCHSLPLGTNGRINFEGDRSGQDFKTPHLRNLYEKLGRLEIDGPVISGYGFGHAGSEATLMELLEAELFTFPGDRGELLDEEERMHMVHYLMRFDTGMAPAVGHQLSVSDAPTSEERARIDTLVDRAGEGDCDLMVSWSDGLDERAWLWTGSGFEPNRVLGEPSGLDELLATASEGRPLTLRCVPPGDGRRSALDRDLDGFLDGDELDAGSDPSDPLSAPGSIRIHAIHLPRVQLGD